MLRFDGFFVFCFHAFGKFAAEEKDMFASVQQVERHVQAVFSTGAFWYKLWEEQVWGDGDVA